MKTQRNNAYTISERAEHMRLLRNAVSKFPDHKSFRIPEAQKAAETYTCDWGAREDGMLCVGIVRHGYGAWPQIRDDPDLGLGDKIFLEEQRVEKKEQRKKGGEQTTNTPQAVHLVRRMQYLLSVLQDKMSNSQNPAARRAVENHHRNNKKNGLHARANSRTMASASPAPSSGHRRPREFEKHRARHNDDRRIPNGETNGYADRPKSRSQRTQNGSHSNERSSTATGNDPSYRKLLLIPIQSNLSALKSATKDNRPDKKDRAQVLRTELQHVGDFVMELINQLDEAGQPKLQSERGLWDYVSGFWPNSGTPTHQIRSMYRRLKGLDKDAEEARVDAEAQAAKARPDAEARSDAQTRPEAAKANGQVNGSPSKSESFTTAPLSAAQGPSLLGSSGNPNDASPPSTYFQRPSLPANTIIRFVPQQTAWVVERMGKYHKILQPGLAILIPFLDRIAYVKSLKEAAMEIPSQSAITADNVTLELDGVLYTRVFDAYKASYGVEDAEYAISQLAQTTMRSEIGRLTLDHVLRERAALNTNITEAINEAARDWGVVCLRYEIRDIHAPDGVVAAMHRQVTAERSKRAEILDSEGQRQSAINIAEGRKQSVILASEALKSEQINIASGDAEAILVRAQATARGIDAVAQSMRDGQESARGAVSLSVAEKYVEAFGNLAKQGTAVVVPGNVGDMSGMIASAMAVYGKVSESQASLLAQQQQQQQQSGSSTGRAEKKEDVDDDSEGKKKNNNATMGKTDEVAKSVLQGFEETRKKR
ncbi:MAG: hypothetical protein Q9177_003141 [Variospora cf. flavescens]